MNEYISDVDREDIKFACSQPINYVAASFVRRKEDILELRKLMSSYGRDDIRVVCDICDAKSTWFGFF